MEELKREIEKIKTYNANNFPLLEEIIYNIKDKIQGRRKIMYSDIINNIIRKGHQGDEYNKILLWCNYKIRYGEHYLNE